jgi:hypothetical protein
MNLFPCSASYIGGYAGAPTPDRKPEEPKVPAQLQSVKTEPQKTVTPIQATSGISLLSINDDISGILSIANDALSSTLSINTGYEIFAGDAALAQQAAFAANLVAYGGVQIYAEGGEVIVTQDTASSSAAVNSYIQNSSNAFNANSKWYQEV